MSKLEKAFNKFHKENPHVYRMFDEYAREAFATGRKLFAVATVWEVMRWYTTVKTNDPTYKLNNNHKAYYARLWMSRMEKREGFFRTRKLRSGE